VSKNNLNGFAAIQLQRQYHRIFKISLRCRRVSAQRRSHYQVPCARGKNMFAPPTQTAEFEVKNRRKARK